MAHTLVIDRPPNDAPAWLRDAVAKAGWLVITADQAADWLSQDKKAQAELIGTTGPDAALAGHYRRALAALAGHAGRRAVCGLAWLTYLEQVDGVVLDLTGLAEEAASGVRKGVAPAEAKAYVERFSAEATALAAKAPRALVMRTEAEATPAAVTAFAKAL